MLFMIGYCAGVMSVAILYIIAAVIYDKRHGWKP